MKARYVLLLALGLFVSIEVANFTGFSLKHMRRLSDEELINAAIRFSYPNLYSSIADLKADYSSFNPEVSYWKDLTGEAGSQFWNKFFGFKRFHVRLPDAVVVMTADGEASHSRPCGENRWCSPAIAPDRPKLGVVGAVQGGPPNYDPESNFTVEWVNGSEGTVFVSGNCFSAFSQSPKPALRITNSDGEAVVTIDGQYGYRLVVLMDSRRSAHSSGRITEQEFEKSRTCDKAARAKWPNVGGAPWKR